jgi:hypothetical protein
MSVISGFAAADATKDAGNNAADSTREAARTSAEVQRYMFDQQQAMHQPYQNVGMAGINRLLPGMETSPKPKAPEMPDRSLYFSGGSYRSALEQYEKEYARYQQELSQWEADFEKGIAANGVDPTGGAGEFMDRLKNMTGPNLPQLNLGQFSFQFDPNDPTYQYRQQQMQKTIDQAAAARGNYNSRAAINALSEGNMALTADESERQFGRALAGYGTNRETALSQYGADYGRATDIFNQERGNVTDLYNMAMQQGSANYSSIIDMLKIGQGSAHSAGQGAIATGQGLANTYGNMGNSLANIALMQGQNMSNLYSGIGASGINAGTAYLMNRPPSTPNYAAYGGTTGYANTWTGNSGGYGAGYNPDPY